MVKRKNEGSYPVYEVMSPLGCIKILSEVDLTFSLRDLTLWIMVMMIACFNKEKQFIIRIISKPQWSMTNDQCQIWLFMCINMYLSSKDAYCMLSLTFICILYATFFCRRFLSVSDPNYANILLIPQNPLDCGAGWGSWRG